MRSSLHFGNQIIVLPLRPAGAIYVKDNFHHTSGNISVQGSSADGKLEVPCSGAPLELIGTAPDVCGDCSPLDTLLGFGFDTGEMFGVICHSHQMA